MPRLRPFRSARAAASLFRVLLALPVLLALAGCGKSLPPPAAPGSASPGTQRPYTVRGTTYRPLASAAGYAETGIASWYGRAFHGRRTANNEIYDMHALTAAHKRLPMNTRVRVSNLANGRSVEVRINDRGPFVAGRIIDLSYAAAKRLDMLGAGTARVRVEAQDDPGTAAAAAATRPQGRYYVQVGAFAQKKNANDTLASLKKVGFASAIAREAVIGGQRLWRVLVGGYPNRASAQAARRALAPRYPSGFVTSR